MMESYLQTNPLFAGIEPEFSELLWPKFERVSFDKNAMVIEQDTIADCFYLVESGKAAILFKPYDGEVMTLTHVSEGDLFGWSALVGSLKYTSSVMVVKPMVVWRTRGRELRKICAKHPDAGRVILERLASAVSARWGNAHEQVKAILENGIIR